MEFGAEQTSDWYNNSWYYRKKITIPFEQVLSNEPDFPVLATTTLDSAKVHEDGYDILFTASDGTSRLNHEREYYSSTTGELVAWVKTDISSTTDTVLYLYYGNASTTDQATTTGVWDDNYIAVWHMNNDGDSSTTDSTINSHHGTTVGPTATSSQIDGGLDFYNGDYYLNMGNIGDWDLAENSHTLQAWFKSSTPSATARIFSRFTGGSSLGYWVGLNTNGTIQAEERSSGDHILLQSPSGYDDNTWHSVTYVVDTSITTGYLYLDGNEGATPDTYTGDLQNLNVDLSVGYDIYGSGFPWGGIIDEARISSSSRSTGWIKTEYSNQSSVENFLSIGEEETVIWRFYDNTNVLNGDTATSTLLSSSEKEESYQEANTTASNPTAIPDGQEGEWDFALDPAVATNTTYYFRLVKDDGNVLFDYTNYPEVTVNVPAGGPETTPTEFISIVDPGQGTDYDFSSLSEWENVIQSDLSTTTGTLVFSYSKAIYRPRLLP
jgi:hypothetical protein